jgi:iron complex transport system substrate-binding protein
MVRLALLWTVWGVGVSPPAAPPQRIVSTAPSATEMLYALGLGDRVVGVTTFCHYPPEAAKKPKIGDYLHPSLETIVGLRPDLVVSETTGVRHAERLRSLNLNVLEFDDATLAGIYDSIHRIGQAAGVLARADKLCAEMRAQLDAIQAKVARLPRRRALFLVGRTPGRIEDLIAAGRRSHLNELIEIAGGENVFRDSVAAYGKIPLEELLARNPEAIVDMGEMSETVGVTEAQKQAVVALWNRYPALAAVREHRVYAVASDIYVVPGPRVVDAARALARMLHPEAGL